MKRFVIEERDELKNITAYDGAPQKPGMLLDANESAWAMPEKVRAKVVEKLGGIAFNRYPQIDANDLREKIAKDFSFTKENVQLGNGSSELLYACCYAFGGAGRKIAYISPSFSMYKVYVEMSGSIDKPFSLEEDFMLDYEKLKNFIAEEQPHVLIICNPNNPTGTHYDKEKLLCALKNSSCLVVMDEAYMEFASGSMVDVLNDNHNMIVMRTFSKAYGLASNRIGYALCANKDIIKTLTKVLLPYHINAMTLTVAGTVWDNRDKYESSIESIMKERELFAGELDGIGIKVYPSKTNFLFFTLGSEEKNKKLINLLLEKSIYLRDFSSSQLLGGIRMTIGRPEENREVLSVIKECSK